MSNLIDSIVKSERPRNYRISHRGIKPASTDFCESKGKPQYNRLDLLCVQDAVFYVSPQFFIHRFSPGHKRNLRNFPTQKVQTSENLIEINNFIEFSDSDERSSRKIIDRRAVYTQHAKVAVTKRGLSDGIFT